MKIKYVELVERITNDAWLANIETITRFNPKTGMVIFDDGGALFVSEESADSLHGMLANIKLKG